MAAPSRRPDVHDTSAVKTLAANISRRGAPRRRPASICISTGQTAPGTYLPSWVVKNSPAPSATGRRTPSPDSTCHHTG
ncbi:MAG: hypothetical protein KGQ66_06995 [Acidobacteriota bacterium]|nr:hypothetical protein [Acidobacteriota bacterium]